ncbi:MAG: iron ABC transporter permease [Brachymonas sp.]|nr:iron ABC transporter permease [Brachymonas sp.]
MIAPTKATIQTKYRQFALRRLVMLGVLALLSLVMVVLDIATGPSALAVAEIVRGIIEPAGIAPEQHVILWSIRLPFALMAVFVGSALGLAGAEMQTILNNPLASPFTLGISAAASVGAALVVLSGWSLVLWNENLALTLGAFAMAMLATMLILWLSWWLGASTETLVLFGIGLMFSFEALLWLLQYLADSSALEQIVFWSMGSLARATWNKIAILAILLVACSLWSSTQVWKLTILRAGDEQARSMGVAVERLRLLTLMRISLLSATALSFAGTIGFVGLVGPHVARLLLGEDHRHYLPGSMLAGAIMLSAASALSKSLASGVILPIGIITALVGVPVFVVLAGISRKRHA